MSPCTPSALKYLVPGIICALIETGTISNHTATAAAIRGYESYFLYLGCDPHNEEPTFLQENDNLQGLAHDPNNWFISSTRYSSCTDSGRDGYIWKIPNRYNLANVKGDGSEGDVARVRISSALPELYTTQGYWHVGDLDCYRGFLLVPVETCRRTNYAHAIFIFNADTFGDPTYHYGYIGKANVDLTWRDLGWVAVNPANGHIYTSHDQITNVEEFSLSIDNVEIPWGGIPKYASPPIEFTLNHSNTWHLLDETGNYFPPGWEFQNTQGGAFSETGDVFYFAVGINCFNCGEELPYRSDGLHAFEVQWSALGWRRIMRSYRQDTARSGCEDFYFDWDPDCCSYEEPEGLDVWDLDSDSGDQYYGQLHAVRLSNLGPGRQDLVTIYHYTHTIYTDGSVGPGGDGRPGNGIGIGPFPTVGQAYDLACDGAWLKIKPGSYNEKLSLAKRVRLVPNGAGLVRIGGQ
jgi:hypothetical protein